LTTLNLSPDLPLEQVINRYPLTVDFFVKRGLTEDEWDIRLMDYARQRGVSLSVLERSLENHLNKIVQPEIDDCQTLTCAPLPFCPEETIDPWLNSIYHVIKTILQSIKTHLGIG
jgi:hypothetical protein